MTCDELRVDPQQGFGAGELTRLYDCVATQGVGLWDIV
jgi:hypothetical protein